ncbi:MAG: aldo/keto reductase [Chloroflexi bacterium]|nr:MAG: aldo/keto reductase [Chloroflexota bacterium]
MNPAERVPLGRTGLEVTRLGLGTAPLGGMYQAVTDEQGAALVEAAWAAGLRFFDTAPLYGHGAAERRLGAGLRSRPRDEFVLSTKVGRVLRAGVPPDPGSIWVDPPPDQPVFDYSQAATLASFSESLERLGLDRVDVLHIHDPDDHYGEALGGAYRVLDRLRAEGRIRAVGAGMNQAAMLARFAREGRFDCFLLAGRFTLLDQSGLDELLPLCERDGIAVIAGGAFNSGILADPRPGVHYNYLPAAPELVERALRLAEVCDRHGVPLAAAAIQFPLRHPAVAAVLVGARSAAELEEDVRLFGWEVPDELWADLRATGLVRDPAA